MRFLFTLLIVIFFGANAYSIDSELKQKIDLVSDFLEKINSEKQFEVSDENHFLGNLGGIAGICLYNQLGLLDLSNMSLKKQLPFSPIGTLLQIQRDKIFPYDKYNGALLFNEAKSFYIQRPNSELQELSYPTSYILVIGMQRKGIRIDYALAA